MNVMLFNDMPPYYFVPKHMNEAADATSTIVMNLL